MGECDAPNARQMVTCRMQDALHVVVEKLAVSGLHRVFVVDAHDVPIGVVSQREVIARMVREPPDSTLLQDVATST